MERSVSEVLCLYPDRGMQKWLGWILSDHSAYMEDQPYSETPVAFEEEQNT